MVGTSTASCSTVTPTPIAASAMSVITRHGMRNDAPLRITPIASITLLAAPTGRPECTPTAANRSGCASATMAAIAPPADRPAM